MFKDKTLHLLWLTTRLLSITLAYSCFQTTHSVFLLAFFNNLTTNLVSLWKHDLFACVHVCLAGISIMNAYVLHRLVHVVLYPSDTLGMLESAELFRSYRYENSWDPIWLWSCPSSDSRPSTWLHERNSSSQKWKFIIYSPLSHSKLYSIFFFF